MDTFIGQIEVFPYGFAPQSWAPCHGQMLSIQQYPALYSLIGNKFGSGGGNFALPNMKGPVEGTDYYIALEGMMPIR